MGRSTVGGHHLFSQDVDAILDGGGRRQARPKCSPEPTEWGIERAPRPRSRARRVVVQHLRVLIRWRTVVKHEAMAVRSARLRLIGSAEPNLDAREATHLAGSPERVADRELAHRSLAALASLKPAETRALVLQAAGRSYRDIEAETGWT